MCRLATLGLASRSAGLRASNSSATTHLQDDPLAEGTDGLHVAVDGDIADLAVTRLLNAPRVSPRHGGLLNIQDERAKRLRRQDVERIRSYLHTGR